LKRQKRQKKKRKKERKERKRKKLCIQPSAYLSVERDGNLVPDAARLTANQKLAYSSECAEKTNKKTSKKLKQHKID
jgi:hypothetical protein